jgi:hypothetical protein
MRACQRRVMIEQIVGQSRNDVLPIERELAGEKAAMLGLAGERFESALAALARFDAEQAAREPAEREALAGRRRDLRAHAAERLWYLLVQREAMGLGHHEGLFQYYRVPAEVRMLAGPRRRP